MGPQSIDTFRGPFPAVLLMESCGFVVKKSGCFGGPNKLVHFLEKPFTFNLAAPPPSLTTRSTKTDAPQ